MNELLSMELVRMSLSASAMIAVILFLRGVARKWLPKRMFFLLWLGVLVVLLNPFEFSSPISVQIIWDKISHLLMLKEQTTVQQIMVVEGLNEVQTSLTSKVVWLWLIGALALAGSLFYLYNRSVRIIRMALPLQDQPAPIAWLQQQKLVRSIQCYYSDQLHSPITGGLRKPKIVFPKNFDYQDEQQLSFVLTHELVHIKRLDALWKFMMLVALCVHWFNPLVWMMYVLMNRDMELSCDEQVLQQLGISNRHAYAKTLLRTAWQKQQLASFYNGYNMFSIEERIESIMKFKKATFLTTAATIAFVAGTTFVFATTEPVLKEDVELVKEQELPMNNETNDREPKLVEQREDNANDESNHVFSSPASEQSPMLIAEAEARVEKDGKVILTNLRDGGKTEITLDVIRKHDGYWELAGDSDLIVRLDGDTIVFEQKK